MGGAAQVRGEHLLKGGDLDLVEGVDGRQEVHGMHPRQEHGGEPHARHVQRPKQLQALQRLQALQPAKRIPSQSVSSRSF